MRRWWWQESEGCRHRQRPPLESVRIRPRRSRPADAGIFFLIDFFRSSVRQCQSRRGPDLGSLRVIACSAKWLMAPASRVVTAAFGRPAEYADADGCRPDDGALPADPSEQKHACLQSGRGDLLVERSGGHALPKRRVKCDRASLSHTRSQAKPTPALTAHRSLPPSSA